MSDSNLPPRQPPPRLRPVPTAKPQPDQFAVADALDSLGRRVGTLEEKMAALFKRSVVTVIAADVILGVVKFAAELLTK